MLYKQTIEKVEMSKNFRIRAIYTRSDLSEHEANSESSSEMKIHLKNWFAMPAKALW